MAGADRTPLRRYADDIGLAFQIADDLLDLESTPERSARRPRRICEKAKPPLHP